MAIIFSTPHPSAVKTDVLTTKAKAVIHPSLIGSDLAWSVSKEKLKTESGIEVEQIAIVRDDTRKVLGVHSQRYTPFQNSEMYELLENISGKTGLTIHGGSYFGDGEKVYLQLKSDSLTLGNDKVQGFLTCCNSFDGSTALRFGNSNVTISCQNTFFMALKEVEHGVRHTSGMFTKIDDILREIDKMRLDEIANFRTIEKLASEPFSTSAHLPAILNRLFDIDSQAVIMNAKFNDEDTLSTRKKNLIEAFDESLTSEMTEKGHTLWGAFSGVTHFTTHKVSKTKDTTESKLFGAWGDKERAIYRSLALKVA
jgi:hypothetical protein